LTYSPRNYPNRDLTRPPPLMPRPKESRRSRPFQTADPRQPLENWSGVNLYAGISTPWGTTAMPWPPVANEPLGVGSEKPLSAISVCGAALSKTMFGLMCAAWQATSAGCGRAVGAAGPVPNQAAQLFLVADIVDADGRPRGILDRFVACHIGRTQNGHLAVVLRDTDEFGSTSKRVAVNVCWWGGTAP
jgi:hypothetical protein